MSEDRDETLRLLREAIRIAEKDAAVDGVVIGFVSRVGPAGAMLKTAWAGVVPGEVTLVGRALVEETRRHVEECSSCAELIATSSFNKLANGPREDDW